MQSATDRNLDLYQFWVEYMKMRHYDNQGN